MNRPWPGGASGWGHIKAYSLDEMDCGTGSLARRKSSPDMVRDYSEPEISDSPDTRPSILITFQNSASYYTSYMGAGGTRGAGPRRKTSDAVEPQQHKDHPIVVMNDYPTPAPVCVTVNSRKRYDGSFAPYSGPPAPHGPPGPPGPPLPNLPPSRRESLLTNSLELPQKRRASNVSPTTSRSHSPADRLLSPRTRTPTPISRTLARPHARLDNYECSSLPRPYKARPPRNSHSMPALADVLDSPCLDVPPASPRPSVCSSAMTESHVERRPLMYEHRSPEGTEEMSISSHPKPNWLSLSLSEEERKPNRVSSVYVAEVWPSLVCILTAVLMTLIVYILVSYYYSVPHPSTRNRIAPSPPKPSGYPPYPTHYPYPHPYIPPPYDRYPQYPQHPPPTDT